LSGWNLIDSAITSNAVTAPDGYNGADKMYATGGSTRHINYGTLTASGTLTFSVFAKAGEKNWLYLRLDNDTPEVNTWFNLSTGTIGTSQGGSPTITSYGNGWYRCSVSYTTSGSETIYNVIGVANANGNQAWTPSGTDGLYIWGAQLEAGSYATSYIPTLGSSVTRLADAASKTSATALIGQTEGTLFAEIQVIAGTINIGIWLRQSGSLYDNFMLFHINISSLSRAEIVNGGVQQVNITGGVVSPGFHKMAFAYKANDVAFYIDGVQIAVGTSATIPTCDEIYIDQYIDGSSRNATKKQAAIYPVRLSNSELASLTSL
jgi:hypothetical protein